MLTAVVPAAGSSKRMRFPKGALLVGGASLSMRHCDALFQVADRVLFVLGWGRGLVERGLPSEVERVVAPRWWQGAQIDSVRLALEGVVGPVLVQPVDVPPASPAVLAGLRSTGECAVPVYRGRRGHPVLLSAQAVAGLRARAPDGGLREVLAGAVEVPVDEPSILDNLNDPRALARWLRRDGCAGEAFDATR
jgi:molybdenum cofactor cytidylyltransferase